jgi:hypothetical protein
MRNKRRFSWTRGRRNLGIDEEKASLGIARRSIILLPQKLRRNEMK